MIQVLRRLLGRTRPVNERELEHAARVARRREEADRRLQGLAERVRVIEHR